MPRCGNQWISLQLGCCFSQRALRQASVVIDDMAEFPTMFARALRFQSWMQRPVTLRISIPCFELQLQVQTDMEAHAVTSGLG